LFAGWSHFVRYLEMYALMLVHIFFRRNEDETKRRLAEGWIEDRRWRFLWIGLGIALLGGASLSAWQFKEGWLMNDSYLLLGWMMIVLPLRRWALPVGPFDEPRYVYLWFVGTIMTR